MLAWILEYAGLNPGFLIGGVPKNFGISARLGGDRYFVIEADEYDTAFFDKRSKFLHYRPRTLIINNVEFDHADIFPNLEAIQRQFHHLIRTVPGSGLVIRPNKDRAVDAIMAQGLWTPTETFGPDASQWTYQAQSPDVSELTVFLNGTPVGTINWSSIGDHNAFNGMAAIAAARHVGVAPATACKALGEFQGVKRRLEKIADVRGIAVYDDFAHHPTEIAASVTAMRRRIGNSRLIAVFEPRSNTMRLGSHQNEIAQAFKAADLSIFFQPPRLDWDLPGATAPLGAHRVIFDDLDSLIAHLAKTLSPDDHCLIMSNGGFGGIHGKLIARLSNA
jgi:UDP-N-acetylmuramate: L-alanyl-gamma-D-glutamyl-meso-diaminopimelate ligase